MTSLLFVALLGFAAQILSRGVFVGRHLIAAYAAVLVAEAALRLLAAGAMVLGGADPLVSLAVGAVVVGCFGWLPLVVVLARSVDWRGPRAAYRPVTTTVTALATATGLSALILTGFPALATVVVGQVGELADLFAVITLSRVPLVLLAPVQALAIPVAIRWIRTGRVDRLRSSLWWMTGLGVVAAGLAALVGEGVGPVAVTLFMGDRYTPGRGMCALVLAATCLVAVALLQAAVLIALRRYWVVAACWFVSVTVAVLFMWLPDADPDVRALCGFVAAAVAAQVTTALTAARAAAAATVSPPTVVDTGTPG